MIIDRVNRKFAYDVTHLAPKKWQTKNCNLFLKGIGRTPILGIILKTSEKLIILQGQLSKDNKGNFLFIIQLLAKYDTILNKL